MDKAVASTMHGKTEEAAGARLIMTFDDDGKAHVQVTKIEELGQEQLPQVSDSGDSSSPRAARSAATWAPTNKDEAATTMQRMARGKAARRLAQKQSAAILESLRAALRENHGRVLDLFRSWDNDGSGTVCAPPGAVGYLLFQSCALRYHPVFSSPLVMCLYPR